MTLYCWGQYYAQDEVRKKTIYRDFKIFIKGVTLKTDRKIIKDKVRKELSRTLKDYKNLRLFYFSETSPVELEHPNVIMPKELSEETWNKVISKFKEMGIDTKWVKFKQAGKMNERGHFLTANSIGHLAINVSESRDKDTAISIEEFLKLKSLK